MRMTALSGAASGGDKRPLAAPVAATAEPAADCGGE